MGRRRGVGLGAATTTTSDVAAGSGTDAGLPRRRRSPRPVGGGAAADVGRHRPLPRGRAAAAAHQVRQQWWILPLLSPLRALGLWQASCARPWRIMPHHVGSRRSGPMYLQMSTEVVDMLLVPLPGRTVGIQHRTTTVKRLYDIQGHWRFLAWPSTASGKQRNKIVICHRTEHIPTSAAAAPATPAPSASPPAAASRQGASLVCSDF